MTLRNIILATATTAGLLVAASASGASQFAAAPMAAGAAMNCSVPNNVVCTISSNKGIRSVRITANTPIGTVNLVNKTYHSCPKQVKVSWDSAYQNSGNYIVECSTGKLLLKQ